jgi:hypothetical protein
MAKTCIVCDGPAGSGEHIFPACVGGLRVNNGIYCGPHNNGYADLAALLANQLAFFNASLGIRNSRTKQIKPAVLTDPATGLTVNFDGKSLKLAGPQILAQNGNSGTIAFPDKKSMDAFVAQAAAHGVVPTGGEAQMQAYHPESLHTEMVFGGPKGLRAIGYVAQTFLAHCFPDLARNPAMKRFIDYTLNGIGDDFVWWDFEVPDVPPPNAFQFGHRVIVGSDGSHVYGRVSLFSTLNFAMIFYDLASSESKCVLNDIDPMAEKMPDDLKQHRATPASAPVTKPDDVKASLRNAIQSGKGQQVNAELMRRAEDYNRRIDAQLLIQLLDGATDLAAKKQIITDFWNTQPARVQRLLAASLAFVKGQNRHSDPNWVSFVAKLEESTKHDSTFPSGLTTTAEAATKRAAGALTDAMAVAIQQGTLNQDAIEMYIGGGQGMYIAVLAIGA